MSGNKTNIGILSSLRNMLNHSKSLRLLSISGLHKFNDEGQKTVITALKNNKYLKTIDIRYTTDDFYYKLRDKMSQREQKDQIEPIKIKFKDFVRYQKSAEKQVEEDNNENINTTNFHDRIQDYSARVRLFNKEKVIRSKKFKSQATENDKSSKNEDI